MVAGVTLYMLLTDQMPYAVPDGVTPSRRLYETPPPPPSRLNFECDSRLDAIVRHALAFEPRDRYPHADALLEALAAWKPQAQAADECPPSAVASSASLKAILPAARTADRDQAAQWVKQAYAQARTGQLQPAADLLEEALRADPALRASHESRVRLWRMGVAM